MTGSTTLEYRPDIDGLRALAVVLVILFHAGVAPFSGGFIGVDVFFVISGYLITRLIMKERAEGRFSFGRFYMRRIKRLAPALFVTILVTLAVGWFLFPPSGYELLAESAAYAVVSLSNFLFWEQAGYFDVGADIKPLLHTWSLSVEEQFYLLWPVMLLILMRIKWRLAVPVFLLAAALGSLAWAEVTLRSDPEAAFYLLPYRVMELAAGALVNFLPPRAGKARWHGEALAGAGLALIVLPSLLMNGDTQFPGINAIPPVLGTALLIHAGAGTRVATALSWKPVVYIGLISYSLYLVHWPVIVFYGFGQGGDLSPLEKAGVIAASLGLAAIMYHVVEQSFRGRGGIRLPRVPGWAAGLAAGAGALACIGVSAVIYYGEGLPQRYQSRPEVASLLMTMRDDRSGEIAQAQAALPPDAPTLLVTGDSHTMSLWSAVGEWGLDRGIRVDHLVLGGGCPSLYGVHVFGDPQQSADCNGTKDALLADAARQGYDAVILSSRWGLYTSEVTDADPFKAIRPRSLALDPAAGHDGEGDARSRDAFVVGLKQTVDLFTAQGTDVVLVGQAPPVGGRLEKCVTLEASVAGIFNNCQKATYNDIMREISWATEAAAAMDLPGLHVVDSRALFCAKEKCDFIRDGKLLYYDDNHLSQWGGRVMLGGMTDILADAVER